MQRRGNQHDSSSMRDILAPDARKPSPKNFQRENIQAMHNFEQEIQRKREQDAQGSAASQMQPERANGGQGLTTNDPN